MAGKDDTNKRPGRAGSTIGMPPVDKNDRNANHYEEQKERASKNIEKQKDKNIDSQEAERNKRIDEVSRKINQDNETVKEAAKSDVSVTVTGDTGNENKSSASLSLINVIDSLKKENKNLNEKIESITNPDAETLRREQNEVNAKVNNLFGDSVHLPPGKFDHLMDPPKKVQRELTPKEKSEDAQQRKAEIDLDAVAKHTKMNEEDIIEDKQPDKKDDDGKRTVTVPGELDKREKEGKKLPPTSKRRREDTAPSSDMFTDGFLDEKSHEDMMERKRQTMLLEKILEVLEKDHKSEKSSSKSSMIRRGVIGGDPAALSIWAIAGLLAAGGVGALAGWFFGDNDERDEFIETKLNNINEDMYKQSGQFGNAKIPDLNSVNNDPGFSNFLKSWLFPSDDVSRERKETASDTNVQLHQMGIRIPLVSIPSELTPQEAEPKEKSQQDSSQTNTPILDIMRVESLRVNQGANIKIPDDSSGQSFEKGDFIPGPSSSNNILFDDRDSSMAMNNTALIEAASGTNLPIEDFEPQTESHDDSNEMIQNEKAGNNVMVKKDGNVTNVINNTINSGGHKSAWNTDTSIEGFYSRIS